MKRVIGCLFVYGGLMLSAAHARVSEAYLLSSWKEPGNNSTAPFTVVGTDGVRLTLNTAGLAVGQVGITDPVLAGVTAPLTYYSHSGSIDARESFGSIADRVNSEVGRMDDVGFLGDGVIDAPLNVDFGQGGRVVFQPFTLPISTLVIGEDAGLDYFRLEYSTTPDFRRREILFNGFSAAVRNAILARPDFGPDDRGTDLDQLYVFRFDQALEPGYLRITEIGNLSGSRLELDFVGAAGKPNFVIPEPNAFVLAGAGVLLTALLLRRR